MHLSHYLKIWPHPNDPELTLFYSLKKSSLALVPTAVADDLRAGGRSHEYLETLIELGMLVPDLEQEHQEVTGLPDELNRLNPNIVVSVILGLACNFECVYCYEGSLKTGLAMDDKTADQIPAFIKSRIRPGKEKIRLDFYGGEPLLYTKQLKRVARAVQQLAQEQGLEFYFTLVTNGSLLTPKLVEELKPLGLKAAKVTVDGPATIHNQMRPFKNGTPSFETIMVNLDACADILRIGVWGNFSRNHYQEFPNLLDELGKRGLTPERLNNVCFLPVGQTTDQYANPEFTGGCVSSDEPWMAEASILLREATMKRGYKTPKLGPTTCMVDMQDGFTINHDGGIFKCVAQIGHEQLQVGDIWQGVGDYRELYYLDRWLQHEECDKCEYLPLCFGGCRDMQFQRTGSMAQVECMRDFFEATLETMIGQDVKYRY